MADFAMTIGGAPVAGAGGLPVSNPATGEVFATAPACAPRQLDEAMRAAARAQHGWRRDEDARRAALTAAARAVRAHLDELAPMLTAEQGKPRADAYREVLAAAEWLRWCGEVEQPAEPLPAGAGATLDRRPLGVVAAIAPANYPLALAMWKVAPALRAGNTVVLKPAPATPLATLLAGAVLARCLPPGVLNVVTGPDPLGASLVAHPTARMVAFTGSTAVGRRVAVAAARGLKRVVLELGGNDPALLLDDVAVDSVAEPLFWAAMTNSGQMCAAVKRVYVPRRLRADLVAALAALARRAPVGDGRTRGVRLGPLGRPAQVDRVAALVTDATERGAVVAAGGRRLDRPGNFYAPTVLDRAQDGMGVVDEEQFGPVLPVVAYDDLDAVVARCNDSPYGLTASVWSADADRAAAVAERLEYGQVTINAHASGIRPDLPFAGHRDSGIGVENGLLGLRGYGDVRVLLR